MFGGGKFGKFDESSAICQTKTIQITSYNQYCLGRPFHLPIPNLYSPTFTKHYCCQTSPLYSTLFHIQHTMNHKLFAYPSSVNTSCKCRVDGWGSSSGCGWCKVPGLIQLYIKQIEKEAIQGRSQSIAQPPDTGQYAQHQSCWITMTTNTPCLTT